MLDQDTHVDLMMNMGPQHPSTHGVFRMVLEVDGERIIDVTPHIGYLHRGSEKLCEGEQYAQIVTLFDRLDYISNFNNEWVFARAVEKLSDIQVPERAEHIRVILCEFNRIASHLLFYGTFGLDAGAMTPIMYGFREREKIQSMFESVSGARMMHNFIRPGGIKQDVPTDFPHRIENLLGELERGIEECDKLLTFNEILLSRSRGVGLITTEEAIDFGMSGPNLRGCGIAEDLRKTESYSIYPSLSFNVPVGIQGDSWDRYYVRVQEMKESIKIIRQAISQMETGPIMAQIRRIARPPAGDVYVRGENPRGDFGVYLVSQGGDTPYRVKVRAPSFCNLMALRRLLKGAYVADAIIILGSLDIVLGEVDR